MAVKRGEPKGILGASGSTLCPSVVSLDADGSIIVGEPARRRLLTQPERTIYSVKRLMGRGPADVQSELKLFSFRIDPPSKSVIRVRSKEHTSELQSPDLLVSLLLTENKSSPLLDTPHHNQQLL